MSRPNTTNFFIYWLYFLIFKNTASERGDFANYKKKKKILQNFKYIFIEYIAKERYLERYFTAAEISA